eukprot:11192967-Lingulodinium_polyedra.AAC.1
MKLAALQACAISHQILPVRSDGAPKSREELPGQENHEMPVGTEEAYALVDGSGTPQQPQHAASPL